MTQQHHQQTKRTRNKNVGILDKNVNVNAEKRIAALKHSAYISERNVLKLKQQNKMVRTHAMYVEMFSLKNVILYNTIKIFRKSQFKKKK